MSSDKIEKKNKKKHTESSYAYFPILFHIRISVLFFSLFSEIFCLLCPPAKKGWERDALFLLTGTHVYILSMLFCYVSSFLV